MDTEVLVALISLVGIISSGVISAIISNKTTVYRIDQLEKKVDKHNNVIERTFKLEGQMTEAQHDIKEIKEKL